MQKATKSLEGFLGSEDPCFKKPTNNPGEKKETTPRRLSTNMEPTNGSCFVANSWFANHATCQKVKETKTTNLKLQGKAEQPSLFPAILQVRLPCSWPFHDHGKEDALLNYQSWYESQAELRERARLVFCHLNSGAM